MIKRLKFMFGTLVLALGFLFCFCFAFVSVNADGGTDETTPATPETTEVVEVEETDEEVDSFVDHLKDLKWDEAEAIIGWIITYLVANFGIIAFCVIKLVLNKLNETKQSKAFQDALAKLSLEHQEEVKKMIAEFEAQLETVNVDSKAFIEEQKAKIQELQSDSTKAIAEELKQVNELLK